MSRFKRKERAQKRGKSAGLNLVSLMDIFTILVFFLMVNSSEVEVLQGSPDIKLPDSSSEQRPENQLMIMVSADDLVVQGRPVARIDDIFGSAEPTIAGLATELEYQAQRKGEMPEGGFEVTVMGDREVPYWLLKKILMTCQTADFARISLAVNRIEGVDADSLIAAASSTGAAP